MKAFQTGLIILCLLAGTSSCKKFLEEKSDQRLSTPSSLADLQAIMDNYGIMNKGMFWTNSFSDEFYYDYSDWEFLAQVAKYFYDGYVWKPEVFVDAGGDDDWIYQYRTVFYANTVLDQLEDIVPAAGQNEQWKSIRGQALFARANSFFELAQLYAPQYEPDAAGTAPGIVLRLSSDFNQHSARSTVQETYDRIIMDLNEAVNLLPAAALPSTSKDKMRAGRPAIYALLARVYLQKGDYEKAKFNADQCLNLYNTLIDYNTANPLQVFNPEEIYHSTSGGLNAMFYFGAKADTTLYQSFDDHDLRKSLFFLDNGNGSYTWTGNYTNNWDELFTGIATDEVYLISAESNARLGNTPGAMDDLNTLLSTRWISGTFVPFSASDAEDALRQVLAERRKQLLNRGRRWSDLKRLNTDPRFATSIKRQLNGQAYTLAVGDHRYSMLIPKQVIEQTGIAQNPR